MADENKYRREGKPYHLKSSAQRAAKEDGVAPGQFEIKQNKKGEWLYERTAVNKSIDKQMKEHNSNSRPAKEPKRKRAVVKEDDEDQIDRDLIAGLPEEDPPKPVEEKKETPPPPAPKPVDDDLPRKTLKVVDLVENPERADEVPPIPAPTPLSGRQVVKLVSGGVAVKKTHDNKIHKSRVETPTKRVWHIADEMFARNPNTSRKQVIEECTKQGIAFYTARTQYQQWLTARRESDNNIADKK